jgi:FkbM family methyltransferase
MRHRVTDLPIVRFRRDCELRQRVDVVRGAPRWSKGALRFGVNELLTGATAAYALRRGDLEVMIRHASSDTWVFREVFLDGLYDQALGLLAGSKSPKIVDLGAHVGLFSVRAAASHPGARIVAVEPDRLNLRVLREVLERNARSSHEWTLVEACAATQAGTARLVEDASYVSHAESVGHPPAGFEAQPERSVTEVPAIDALPLIDGAELVKMDIEGSEWAILEDPRLPGASVQHLFLEYHSWACPRPDPRAYAIELVERAGFSLMHAPPAEEHQGVLLATRG